MAGAFATLKTSATSGRRIDDRNALVMLWLSVPNCLFASEGKPNFSRLFLSRIRVAKVLSVLLIPPLVIFSYDDVGKETAITPIQRGFSSWWSAFTALDEADVRKARALGPSPARLRAAAEAEGEAREARAAAAANAVAPPPSR